MPLCAAGVGLLLLLLVEEELMAAVVLLLLLVEEELVAAVVLLLLRFTVSPAVEVAAAAVASALRWLLRNRPST